DRSIRVVLDPFAVRDVVGVRAFHHQRAAGERLRQLAGAHARRVRHLGGDRAVVAQLAPRAVERAVHPRRLDVRLAGLPERLARAVLLAVIVAPALRELAAGPPRAPRTVEHAVHVLGGVLFALARVPVDRGAGAVAHRVAAELVALIVVRDERAVLPAVLPGTG